MAPKAGWRIKGGGGVAPASRLRRTLRLLRDGPATTVLSCARIAHTKQDDGGAAPRYARRHGAGTGSDDDEPVPRCCGATSAPTARRRSRGRPARLRFSLARTRRFDSDPLGLLLESYERYGPVFTLKIFHHNAVFMLGPAANHYILVSHAKNFLWREGHLRDLIPLLGDGLLTIDGAFHRTHRKLMLPAFHREQIAAATA